MRVQVQFNFNYHGLGPVYTDTVSLFCNRIAFDVVTNAVKSGAFSKRYGCECRVNGDNSTELNLVLRVSLLPWNEVGDNRVVFKTNGVWREKCQPGEICTAQNGEHAEKCSACFYRNYIMLSLLQLALWWALIRQYFWISHYIATELIISLIYFTRKPNRGKLRRVMKRKKVTMKMMKY